MGLIMDSIISFKSYSKDGLSAYLEQVGKINADSSLLYESILDLRRNIENVSSSRVSVNEKYPKVNERLFSNLSVEQRRHIQVFRSEGGFTNANIFLRKIDGQIANGFVKDVNIFLNYLLHYYADIIDNASWFDLCSISLSNVLIDTISEDVPLYDMLNFPEAYGLNLLESIWLNPHTLKPFYYTDFEDDPQSIFEPVFLLPKCHYVMSHEGLLFIRSQLIKSKLDIDTWLPFLIWIDFIIESNATLVLKDNRGS